MSILDDDVAELVSDGLEAADVPQDAVVLVTVPGEVNPEEPWVIPTSSVTQHPCRGWVENQSDYRIANSMVEAGDRKVMILRTSLAIEPKAGMSVLIGGVNYSVIKVDADPARALWSIQARA